MKKFLFIVATTMAAVFATAQGMPSTPTTQRKGSESQLRSLLGQVMGHKDSALPEAIVYLKNTKSLAVRTFIADKNGEYQFNALAPNIDYEIFAEYDGKKSDVKTLSAFDNRNKAYINLHIDTPKK